MGKPEDNVDISTKEMTFEEISVLHHHTSTPHETIVCINLFNKFQRFDIDRTQGTLTNTGFYAAPPPTIPQICLNVGSHQFTQDRLFALISSRLSCVDLSERIAKEIAAQGKRNIGFLLQFEHMSVNVVLTHDLFVTAPAWEEETQKEEDEDDEPTCAICLQGLVKDEKLKLLHCPHRFHLECISMWLLKRNSCPLCREVVFEESCLSLVKVLADFPQKVVV